MVKRAQGHWDLKFGILYLKMSKITSLPKFAKFTKKWYGSECKCNICKYSDNTIVELHTLAWICPSGNLIPNIKRNIKRNETVLFWWVYSSILACSHSLAFIIIIFFFCFRFNPFNNGFYCTKFGFPFNSSCKYLPFMFHHNMHCNKWIQA